MDIRQVAASVEQRFDITGLFRFLDDILHELLHTRIFVEITVNEFLSSFSGDVYQVLGQTVVTDTAKRLPKLTAFACRRRLAVTSSGFSMPNTRIAVEVWISWPSQEGFSADAHPGNMRQHTQFDL